MLQNEEFKSDQVNVIDQQFMTYSEGLAGAKESIAKVINESFEIEEKSNHCPDLYNQMKRPTQGNNERVISLNSEDVNDVNQHADELIETLPNGSLKCKHCGKIANKGNLKSFSRRNMRNHVETHLDGLSFDCKLCGKTFRSRPSLNMHISRQHRSR